MEFDELSALIRARRTSMHVDQQREVDDKTIEQLCELAQWAPNHKRTWPWRFASFSGDARARLGQAFVADMAARDYGDEGKREKTLTKYLRTPAVLVVGTAAHDHPSFHDENRDAVAAGIQNILLGATALGLASYWSTPPLADSAQALALSGFEPDVRLVGVIYLGWASGIEVRPPERPPVSVTHVA
jgi:nitroreductase